MFYELVSSEQQGAITVSDAKDFLKVDCDITKDDNLISEMILAVFEYAERYTGYDLREKTWNAFYENLCVTNSERLPFIELNRPPINNVTTVEVSKNGTYAASTDFIRKRGKSSDRLLFTKTPLLDQDAAYTFKVTFDSGYTAENIPKDLKQALFQHISFIYENRGDAPSDPPIQVLEVYGRHRTVVNYAA